MVALVIEYWPWLVAYPFVGAAICGLCMDRPSNGQFLLCVFIWPLVVALMIGAFLKGLFS